MKLVYKLVGLGLGAGASATAYLLIPSSSTPVEQIEAQVNPNRGAWQKPFIDQGYVPLVIGDKTVDFQGLFAAYKEANNIELLGEAESQFAKLCNSFNDKEALDEGEVANAKRWCFKPRTVSDILERKGRRPIYKNQEDGEHWENEKLRELAQKYSQNHDRNLKMETAWNDPTPLDMQNVDIEQFKNACVITLGAKSYDEKLDQKTNSAEKWCTEEANS